MATEIMIRGMVCERCITIIRDGLTAFGFEVESISLGKLTFARSLDDKAKQTVESYLIENGFALISNRQIRIVNQVKQLIDDVFSDQSRRQPRIRFATYLPENLHLNYDSISHSFAELEGVTLEKYIISKRIDKVKELLVYTNRSLTEIAYDVGFSSINHLSRQFKDYTGQTPTCFRSAVAGERKRTANRDSQIM